VSPITHLLVSWSVADSFQLSRRDLALVTLCGILPDLDGVVVVVDLGARAFGRPDPFLYGQYHHMLTHGLPAALLFAALAGVLADERVRTAAMAFAVVHLHLLCDLVGSRGPDPADIWPLPYLAPLSSRLTLAWSGQWQLNAWPNLLLSIALLFLTLLRAWHRGYSPVGMLSTRADDALVRTLRARFSRFRPEA
jgi:inner membrane protein